MTTEFAHLDNGLTQRIIRKRENRNWDIYVEDVGDTLIARQLVDILNANEQVPPPQPTSSNTFNFVAPSEPSPIFEWDGTESTMLQEFLGDKFKYWTTENVSGQVEDKLFAAIKVAPDETVMRITGPHYVIKLPEGILAVSKDAL